MRLIALLNETPLGTFHVAQDVKDLAKGADDTVEDNRDRSSFAPRDIKALTRSKLQPELDRALSKSKHKVNVFILDKHIRDLLTQKGVYSLSSLEASDDNNTSKQLTDVQDNLKKHLLSSGFTLPKDHINLIVSGTTGDPYTAWQLLHQIGEALGVNDDFNKRFLSHPNVQRIHRSLLFEGAFRNPAFSKLDRDVFGGDSLVLYDVKITYNTYFEGVDLKSLLEYFVYSRSLTVYDCEFTDDTLVLKHINNSRLLDVRHDAQDENGILPKSSIEGYSSMDLNQKIYHSLMRALNQGVGIFDGNRMPVLEYLKLKSATSLSSSGKGNQPGPFSKKFFEDGTYRASLIRKISHAQYYPSRRTIADVDNNIINFIKTIKPRMFIMKSRRRRNIGDLADIESYQDIDNAEILTEYLVIGDRIRRNDVLKGQMKQYLGEAGEKMLEDMYLAAEEICEQYLLSAKGKVLTSGSGRSTFDV